MGFSKVAVPLSLRTINNLTAFLSVESRVFFGTTRGTTQTPLTKLQTNFVGRALRLYTDPKIPTTLGRET